MIDTLRNDRRGQSFIEAMVAITIIVTSITSALALVSSSLTAMRISGSEVIAANLAREGLEVVRSVRDTNWLSGRAFQFGLTDPSFKTARPLFDVASGTWTLEFFDLELEDPQALVYVLPEGTYVQTGVLPIGASASPYRRRLVIDYVCRDGVTGDERVHAGVGNCSGSETLVGLAVRAEISFVTTSGRTRIVQAEERLYDWR